MNIFGYAVVGNARYEAIKKDLLRNQAEVTRLRQLNLEDAATITTLKQQARQMTEERDGLQNLVNSAQERESDLQRRLTAAESLNVAAQKGRITHNDLLFRVGKNWLEFKKAWQFRKDNPKMNPKERIANNETLDRSITAVDAYLPKKILDPSEKAIADIAGDADPSPAPYASNPRAG